MPFSIAVIYGSVREKRQGIKAARFVVKQIEKRGHAVTLIDPLVYKFPLLEKVYKDYPAGEAPEAIDKVAKILEQSDGFVVVTGEYNHTIPPALTNILDHFHEEYIHKPSAIASYSSGSFAGIRAAMHLRITLSNLGTPSIPTTFPVLRVQDSFDEEGNAIDKEYEKRIIRFLKDFEWYLEAFRNQRMLDR